MANDYVLATNESGELAVRTVSATEASNITDTLSVITRTDDGKLAVRTVGGGGDAHNKGYFATLAELQEAYPTGEAGDWAIVAESDTVYIWDATQQAWVDTDQKGQVTSVNGQTGDVVIPAGATYTAGTGISIDANNEISVTNPVVTNSATEQTALAVGSISNPATASSGAYWAAAVGANASVTAADGVAVGANTSITAADGVAIGPGARVTAAHAIQISSWDRGTRVTNSVANTVNIANGIANYRVLEADGSIPADRLTHAINKYSTMPTASASNEGWIVQFTGTTDATYTHGYIYECKAQGTDPETYAWEAMTVQAGGGGGSSYTAGTGIDITNDVISTKVSIAYDPANSTDAVAVMSITGGASPSDGDGVLVIGNGAKSNPRYTTFDSKGVVVIGESANAGSTYAGNSVTIGNKSVGALNTVVIGYGANTSAPGAIAIGKNAKVSGSWGGLAIGQETTCAKGGIILNGASNSQGTNTITGTDSCFDVVLSDAFLSYHQYTLLNGAGLIPADRLASTTGLADGNYRLRLVMASGVPTLEWVAE